MERARLKLLLALVALAGCGYAKFRGAIPISSDRHSLRIVGAFSPDGGRFAVAEAKLSASRRETGVLKVWQRGPRPDLPGAWRLATRVDLADLFIVDIAFSPGGKLLAIAGLGRRNNVLLWSVGERRAVAAFRGNAGMTQAIVFGPSEDWLASAGLDGRIHVWDLGSGQRHATVDEDPSLLRQSRFPLAVAGRTLAYGRTDGRVGFADPRTGARLEVRESGSREVFDLAPSPDGRWLAVAGDRGIRLFDLRAPATAAPVLLSRERAPAIAFFPDGKALVACGALPEHSKVHEVPSGRVRYGFLNGSAEARNRRVPDGPGLVPTGTREEGIERHLSRTFPDQAAERGLRDVLIGYARFVAIHRVSVSPEDLWVAFFEGGRASIVITQQHYQLRLRNPAPPPPPPPVPAAPLPRSI
jgi:hypothetical protein